MSGGVVLRRCVSCRERRDRSLLWRIIRQYGDGVVLAGADTRAMGRSAYVCPSSSCIEEAKRRKRLQRSLRCQVSDSIYTALEERLSEPLHAASEAR
ncbi:YlxR family protein [Synechococcus sp. Cruz-9H2]|uniref:YlxR family protein n=1 Tax=unclassified Synechococcus TaxID=2626047 RepID=UPI0020CBBB20|nr:MULTISPECIES: YlxR family protein [unclassified Synechococcus]MCP9819049.1 YlxR family protein [Synechococcus sp. Cruz-9H2]MCP9843553.1 YlxR family protein [Synechococcus sp. Edmonson 11F2]MCP9855728.1 YlxR family protein [Synechococcus sp. Cruz-9C9]MCP9863166.1 YlxR family protein [Synechococcus sp. Cruz-7E5]MCP9869959.1 YlxR family protein [Synechococcus sp. Cruz-7B9]